MALTLIKNGFIVTMDSKDTILENGAIAIEDTKIVAVGTGKELGERYKFDKVIDAHGGVVLPGFLCNHCHTHSQAYIGEPAYDLGPAPLTFLQVLGRDWWPKLEDMLTKEDVYNIVRYTGMQMMKQGYTFVLDVMEAPVGLPGILEAEKRALESIGMRGCPVQEATERISQENGELGLQENLKFAMKQRAEKDPLVRGALCAHTVWSCSEEMLRHMRELADKNRVPMTMHVNESPFEYDYARKHLKKSSFQYLNDIGVLGPDFLAAQCCQTTKEEYKILAEKQVKVSHNIQTNSLFGDGAAPIPALQDMGVTCGMGNDGFFLDPFENLRTIQMIHRAVHRRDDLFPNNKILAYGTIETAKTVWMEKEIGSLEPGKKADLIIVNLRSPAPVLRRNLLDMLVYHGYGTKVVVTMVNGRITVDNQKLLTADEPDIITKIRETAQSIWDRGQKTPLPRYLIYKMGHINQ